MPGIEVWNQFDHDPRSPANAAMRASDKDRAVIETVLADAFAEGRITHEEYDERTDAAMSSRTLGDLVPLVADLPVARPALPDVHADAVRRWARERREALSGFIGVSVITWTIWAVVMFGGFAWPLFPMVAALVNVIRIQVQKADIVAAHERRLLRREERALDLERQEAKELRSREKHSRDQDD